MRQPTPPCNPDDLRRLLEGGVPEVGSERLIEHLDSCEACRHALEGMAAREAWWEEARRLVRPDAARGPAPVGRGRDAAIAGGAAPDEPGRDEEDLDFLTPSAAPGPSAGSGLTRSLVCSGTAAWGWCSAATMRR